MRGAEECHDFGTRTVLELLVWGERGCGIREGTLGVSKRRWVARVRVLLERVRRLKLLLLGWEGKREVGVVREVVGPSGWRVRRRDLLGWRNHDEIGRRRRRGGRRVLRWWWCGCGHEELVHVKRRRLWLRLLMLMLRIWGCHGEREGGEEGSRRGRRRQVRKEEQERRVLGFFLFLTFEGGLEKDNI